MSSYLLAIGTGTSLLLMPCATVSGNISLMDALFTATSAVCVTGLVVVDTGTYFTLFGQGVILILIQLGGLGIMTVSVTIFHLMRKSVSFRQRMAVQDVFAHTPREDIYHLLKAIFCFTGIAELIGATLLFVHWNREYSWTKALYMAVFHSVSAFCNAGFSLLSNSFMDYRGEMLLNLTICALIIFGGIGFPVIYDSYKTTFQRHERRSKLSIQTKTVLITTGILIVFGMFIFCGIEKNALLQDETFNESMLASFFQSVTCRTAGFNTVDIAALNNTTLTFMIFLMFFGASPGSCGGGVKTTTLAVLGAFTWSRLRRRIRVNIFKKSIPKETVTKSISLVVISIGLICMLFFLLLLSAPKESINGAGHGQFLAYLFEVVSAFGTVGLSMGATAEINNWGKFLIFLMMLIGRIGVLTFSYVIAGTEPVKGIEYVEENIMIG
ncbi:MAG: TrkH family potassium uptake protein [Desulfobacterales bacterium]|nr:TrkH family potassium uptake protein [Desulfobacterales bacterium]